MQWFGANYTLKYNICHKRIGHLFQGRFNNFKKMIPDSPDRPGIGINGFLTLALKFE
jgi:hypothetical protein